MVATNKANAYDTIFIGFPNTFINNDGVYPQMLEIRFSNSYVLVGDLLRATFANIQTNDRGGDTPLLPDKVVNVRITNDN